MQVLVDDRRSPVNLEPGCTPTVRWRYDGHDAVTASRYRVLVGTGPDALPKGMDEPQTPQMPSFAASGERHDRGNAAVVWDSGVVEGDGYGGMPLAGLDTAPSRRYWVSVAVWDDHGNRAAWTPPVTFGTGAGRDWIARPIWSPLALAANESTAETDTLTASIATDVPAATAGMSQDAEASSCKAGAGVAADAACAEPMRCRARDWAFLRYAWQLPDREVRWATLHATAASTAPSRQFVYRLWLDGRFVGCGPVFPEGGEARYDGFDVTELLRRGRDHAIGVIAYTTDDRRFAAQLDVGFADGSVRHYGTGPGWRALRRTVYDDAPSIGTQYFDAPGERVDAGRFPRGFSTATYDDGDWVAPVMRPRFADTVAAASDAMVERDVTPVSMRITEAGHLVVDFGRTVMGGIRLEVDADSPVNLTVRYGEELEPDGSVRYAMRTGNVYEDRWRFPRGPHALATWGIRVFRYVDIIPDPPCPDIIHALAARPGCVTGVALEQPYATDAGTRTSFASDNATLTRVWRLGRRTIDALNANLYVDSWTRERAPYEADAWIQQRAHLALDDAPAIGRATVDWLTANRTWPIEWPLYTILAVHDSWMHTGSATQAANHYEQLTALLPDRYLDAASGLIVKDPGESSRTDGDLVDWPQAERDGFVFDRVNTVINALASRAYACMAELADALGRTADARRYAAVAARMREAIHSRLYDAGRGAYRDGLGAGPDGAPIDHCSLHASAFALAFADVPYERIPAVGRYLRSRGMACSVYAAAVYCDGLYAAGLGADANRLIGAERGMRTWAHMLDLGAGATMEAWDPTLKPNTTFSHPWAASPAYLLPAGLLGIRPVEPGWRSFAVIPQPGDVRGAEATVPGRSGCITVRWRVAPRQPASSVTTATLDVTVPPHCHATVAPPASIPAPVSVAPSSARARLTTAVADGNRVAISHGARPQRIAGVWCCGDAFAAIDLPAGTHHIVLRYEQS